MDSFVMLIDWYQIAAIMEQLTRDRQRLQAENKPENKAAIDKCDEVMGYLLNRPTITQIIAA